MLTKTRTHVNIPRKDWDELKHNPNFADLIEFLEDKEDLEKAKLVKGKDISINDYLKKRGLRNNH